MRHYVPVFFILFVFVSCWGIRCNRSGSPQGPQHTSVAPQKSNIDNDQPDNRQNLFSKENIAKTPIAGSIGVGELYLESPLTYKNVALYPISSTKPLLSDTIHTIDTAFKEKKLLVSEEGSGQVPLVAVNKKTREPIFIMTGEMLIGAKQDRISKHDALLPEKEGTFKLPVYCVEQGRWHGSGQFTSGKVVSTQKLRKKAVKKKSQSEVWQEVSQKTHQVNAETNTHTMHASYQSEVFIEKSPAYLSHLGPFTSRYPRSLGVVAVINSTIASVDLFANHELFDNLWEKLLKAIILDAIDPQFAGSNFGTDRLQAFVNSLGSAQFTSTVTPGMGQEFVFTATDVSGSTLIAKNSIIHLGMFPDKETPVRNLFAPPKVQPPSHSAEPTTQKPSPFAKKRHFTKELSRKQGLKSSNTKKKQRKK